MGLELALAAPATYAKREQFETFRRHINAAWVEQALVATAARVPNDAAPKLSRAANSTSFTRSFRPMGEVGRLLSPSRK
jgi:hypothetical protein